MNTVCERRQVRSPSRLRRIWALMRKESFEVVRDPSSVAIGIVMPVMLVLLFGYGLSLDLKNVPIAVVMEDVSPDARELLAGFQLSPYFDARLTTSMPYARQLMLERKVDGIVRVRSDFSRSSPNSAVSTSTRRIPEIRPMSRNGSGISACSRNDTCTV